MSPQGSGGLLKVSDSFAVSGNDHAAYLGNCYLFDGNAPYVEEL
jgi:hypothetical protein